jgi:hypothetical protein
VWNAVDGDDRILLPMAPPTQANGAAAAAGVEVAEGAAAMAEDAPEFEYTRDYK